MIRLATKHDTTFIIDMMKRFRAESPVGCVYSEDDEPYWLSMLANIFAGQGAAFVHDDGGLLLSMVIPSVWSPKVLALHELAWYVVPEKRGGVIGYRLLKEYINHATILKNSGRIKYFTVSKMVSSPDIDYGRFGFRKVDENWIQ